MGFRGLAFLAGILAAGEASGSVKITMTDGHPVVRGVYVNGHGPYSFLLDTGTTANHLDPKVARLIGLNATFRSQLVSSTGTKYVPGTDGVEVILGSVRAEGQRFLFTGMDLVRELMPGVQGVLGQAFLSHFDYLLNLQGKLMEFGKHEPKAIEVRAPLRVDHSRPVVSTSLGELVLDSGTSWVTLFGVESNRARNEMVTMTGSLSIGTVSRKLLIGGRAFWRGEALAVPRSEEPGAEGLLPVSLFKSVYFCNSEGYVSFE
jgi:Aspartyl protease